MKEEGEGRKAERRQWKNGVGEGIKKGQKTKKKGCPLTLLESLQVT